jgi:hypothetical protein
LPVTRTTFFVSIGAANFVSLLQECEISYGGTSLADELRRRFTRARLAAILDHQLKETGKYHARSHVAIVPQHGYLVTIGDGDSLTIRLVEE